MPLAALVVAAMARVVAVARFSAIGCTECQAEGDAADNRRTNPAAAAVSNDDLFARVSFSNEAAVMSDGARQRLADWSLKNGLSS